MNINDKIKQLRQKINEQLCPLIRGNYVYLDLPYYPNIGDNLIWEGTEYFLATLPYKCLYKAGIETYCKQSLPSTTTIIFQGGGNFGDLWERHNIFRKEIIEQNPSNPIIILPQSVYYENSTKIKHDEFFFAQHTNVTLCARDSVSYDFMKEHFPKNSTILVPDMAFYANLNKFHSTTQKNGRILFAKRLDKEFAEISKYDNIPQNVEIHDWPTFEHTKKKYQQVNYLDGWLNFFSNNKKIKKVNILRDILRKYFYKNQYLKDGVNFISQYDTIYATRLHIAIMAAMLGKQVYLIDNSYGKNVNLYNTWLKDLDNVHIF